VVRSGNEDVADLVRRAGEHQSAAVARLISLIERDSPQLREVAAALARLPGRSHVVGLTGSPGVGKSTTTSALVAALRASGRSVGVLAVDPSSPFTGGALLGDRIRMQEHAGDDGVFIRSLASRGQLGGLSAEVPQALRVLEAAGFDVIVIETVGVGQAELDIASLADTVLVVLAPGMGDGIQAVKAGILEIADIYVVNKADREGADLVARDLRHMQTLGAGTSSGAQALGRDSATAGWEVPIVKTASSEGQGIDDLLEQIDRHGEWLTSSGSLHRRRQHRAATEIEAIALGEVRARFARSTGPAALSAAADHVVAGALDPFSAAEQVLDAL
jgi:LAO/AO transport system kinase